MSLTITALKYQDTKSAVHRYMRDNFSWIRSASVIDGVAGKATVNSIDITGNLLVASDCVLDTKNTELVGKEIELDYYNLSFPVEHCDLRRTWLSAFADKYKDEADVYIDALIPYLAEKVGDEVRSKVITDVITEATADVNAVKVTLAGTITSPQNAYNTLLEFIAGFPAGFRDRIFDKHSYEYYEINVSPEVYSLVASHLGDKHGTYGINISGLIIVADKTLLGDSMYCTSRKNILVAFDSAEDLNKISRLDKEWENTSYIITGLAFKGSYVDSSEIVISN